MIARDVMTTRVVTVTPDTSLQAIARLLSDNGISAVVVVDDAFQPLGMVSEGDLVGRKPAETTARRDWWLAQFAEGEALSAEFASYIKTNGGFARDIMTRPVITVEETAQLADIARLLDGNRIKRVPVVKDGKLVGIVSRADLVRAMAKGLMNTSG